jgi:hypothetical protein
MSMPAQAIGMDTMVVGYGGAIITVRKVTTKPAIPSKSGFPGSAAELTPR